MHNVWLLLNFNVSHISVSKLMHTSATFQASTNAVDFF